MLMGESTGETYSNKYRYNGKENLIPVNTSNPIDFSWYDYGARFYDPQIGRWHSVDPMVENNHHDYTPYAYVYNNPIRFYDVMGLDSGDVYIIDREERPVDNGTKGQTYSGFAFVETDDGEYSETYLASSHPNSKSNTDNSPKHNTIKAGKHSYNNTKGHKGGAQKGLNIDDSDNKNRTTTGTDPNGNDVEMQYVNVHKGTSDNGNAMSRGSKGCVTIHPDDADAFFSNFDFSNGNTGNSSGSIYIIRIGRPQLISTAAPDKTKLVKPIVLPLIPE